MQECIATWLLGEKTGAGSVSERGSIDSARFHDDRAASGRSYNFAVSPDG